MDQDDEIEDLYPEDSEMDEQKQKLMDEVIDQMQDDEDEEDYHDDMDMDGMDSE